MKTKVVRVTVTLTAERFAELAKKAQKKGLPTPTYARVLLSELLDKTAKASAA